MYKLAMNSKKTLIFIQNRNYFYTQSRLLQNSNIVNSNNKDPNNKNRWKWILGRKGSKKYSHELADDINKILFYCNIVLLFKTTKRLYY
jgi:hypothetical protein